MALKKVPKDVRGILSRMFESDQFRNIGVNPQVNNIVEILKRKGNVADIYDALIPLNDCLTSLGQRDKAYLVECVMSRLQDSQLTPTERAIHQKIWEDAVIAGRA